MPVCCAQSTVHYFCDVRFTILPFAVDEAFSNRGSYIIFEVEGRVDGTWKAE